MSRGRTIQVNYLARVEGEGSLTIKLKGDKATEVRLGIFEPPRFFEALLRGRAYREAPDYYLARAISSFHQRILKRLFERPQVQLVRPGAATLAVQCPVGVGDCVGL